MRKPIDSLKLSSAEWTKLQQQLNKQNATPEEDQRQGAVRTSMKDGALALLRILTESSQAPHFRIRCRNISSTGIGFMHGQFIHPGTEVEIIFVTQKREGVIVNGKVMRAQLIDGHVHNLGVQFDEPIDLDEIVAMGLAEEPPEPPAPAESAESAEAEDTSPSQSGGNATEKEDGSVAISDEANNDAPAAESDATDSKNAEDDIDDNSQQANAA